MTGQGPTWRLEPFDLFRKEIHDWVTFIDLENLGWAL